MIERLWLFVNRTLSQSWMMFFLLCVFAMAIVAIELKETEKEKKIEMTETLKLYFADLDEDNNGKLSVKEFRNGMRALLSDFPHEINILISIADVDGSKTIEFEEFCEVLSPYKCDPVSESKKIAASQVIGSNKTLED